MTIFRTIFTTLFILAVLGLHAQELQVKVNINHSQISGTEVGVFENLQQTIEQFINERQWTPLQFQKNERIQCSLNITVNAYIREDNRFNCSALIQANRPVYNSAYTSTLYNNKDDQFNFDFIQFDQLNFNDEIIDQQLPALLAYYAYLIIGLNLDSFAPMAGTDVLQRCKYLVNNAHELGRTIGTALPSSTIISMSRCAPSVNFSTTITVKVSTRWPTMRSVVARRSPKPL